MNRTLEFDAILGPAGLERDRAIKVGADGTILNVRPAAGPGQGLLAIPGMPNAHSHSFQRALAGHGEAAAGQDSFWSWRKAMYELAAVVTPSQLYAVTAQAYTQMMCAGFTHVTEFHYLHHEGDGTRSVEMADAILRAAADVGLPISLVPVYYRTSGFGGGPPEGAQRRFAYRSVDGFLDAVSRMQAIAPDRIGGIAAHSLRAVPPEDLGELVAGADRLLGRESPLHIHISEQVREVEECEERYGRTPLELLYDETGLGRRWNLVHATHATAEELLRVRESAARVVLCPLTEAYLGDGVFEAREHFLAAGGAAIGTDSNVRISAIEEVRMLEYSQRLRDQRRARLADSGGVGPPAWAWLAAGGGEALDSGGRFALGTANPGRGKIAAGYRADLVVLSPRGPNLAEQEPDTLMDAWLTAGDDRNIEAVYIGGERLVDGGEVRGQTQTFSAFAEALRQIWSTPN